MSLMKIVLIAAMAATAALAKGDPPLTVEQTLTAAFAEPRAIAQAEAPQVELQRAVLPKQLVPTSASARENAAGQKKPVPSAEPGTAIAALR